MIAVVLLAGCGSDYAGLSRSDAVALSDELTRAFPQVPDEFLPYPRRTRLLGAYRSKTLAGERAWLAIYRFEGEHFGRDQACVWVAAGPYRAYRTAQVPTIAWGRPTPLHERCLDELRSRGFFDPDQTAADESARPTVAVPVAMSPLGPVPPFGYRTEWIEPGSVWLAPFAMRSPVTTARGTWGVAGFVEDADGNVVPRAVIRLWPAGRSEGEVATQADATGAFAFLNMSPAGRYEVVVEAKGFVTHHSQEDFGPLNEVSLWELGLFRPGDPAAGY